MEPTIKELIKKYEMPENIKGTCSIEDMKDGMVSFLSIVSYKKFIKPDVGTIILTSKKIFEEVQHIKGNKFIIVENPHEAFIEFHNAFHINFRPFHTGKEKAIIGNNCDIDETVRFGDNVKIGDNVRIFPYVVIGSNVDIGDGTTIYSSVSIYDNVKIGKGGIIDSNTVIGAEGFSTILSNKKGATRLINIGGVEIGDFVEIGSNVSIDRASFKQTKIEDRVKIDNLVHIAHNVEIGEDTRITPLACIAGSCKIGKRVWIGIGCSIRDHVEVGDDSQVLMNAVLINSIGVNERVGGFYAMPHKVWKAHINDIKNKSLNE